MPTFFKYRGLASLDRIADILVKQRMYCARVSELNDPLEGHFHANIKGEGFSTLAIRDENRRICSFSSTIECILQWSHYADNHRGIAIEFLPDKNPQRVKYSESLYVLNNGKHIDNSELFTKCDGWKHEEEYRYVTHEEECFLSGRVAGVIFGIRTPSSVKGLLGEYCKKIGAYTKNAHLDNKKYKIIVR